MRNKFYFAQVLVLQISSFKGFQLNLFKKNVVPHAVHDRGLVVLDNVNITALCGIMSTQTHD